MSVWELDRAPSVTCSACSFWYYVRLERGERERCAASRNVDVQALAGAMASAVTEALRQPQAQSQSRLTPAVATTPAIATTKP